MELKQAFKLKEPVKSGEDEKDFYIRLLKDRQDGFDVVCFYKKNYQLVSYYFSFIPEIRIRELYEESDVDDLRDIEIPKFNKE